jgi:hypothetical protein
VISPRHRGTARAGGLLLTAILVVGFALAACTASTVGTAAPTPRPASSPPATESSTATSIPSPTSSRTTAACTTRHLQLRPRVDSNAPSKFLFALANLGHAPCVIGGYPGIELDAGGDGRPVITHVSHVARPAARPITLGFRSQADFFLYQPHGTCSQPQINIGELVVTPPDQSARLSLNVTFGLVCAARPVYETALQR